MIRENDLICSIWTNDLASAHCTASAVEAGYVWVNDVGWHFPGTPFGGYKQPRIGREECLEELISYTQEKRIHIRLRQPKNAARWSNRGTDERQHLAGPGDFIEVPSSAKHGFRNRSQHPVIQLITTTSKLGRFLQEVGRPVVQGERVGPPSPDEIQRFVKTAERYGYWLATPEENASLGISLF